MNWSRPACSARSGIEKHGIVEVEGERIYAYEVDGLGNYLSDFDDANGAVPRALVAGTMHHVICTHCPPPSTVHAVQ